MSTLRDTYEDGGQGPHPDRHSEGGVICPNCGHELSMFMEPTITRPERIATAVATAVGSWRFLVVLLIGIIVWLTANVISRSFEPYPQMMLDYLGLGLTLLAAMQLPLILLSQRQDSARDRERDREALRVAAHAEADLHAIRQAVIRLVEASEADHPTAGPPLATPDDEEGVPTR
jgi:uncharacterized membrane protein